MQIHIRVPTQSVRHRTARNRFVVIWQIHCKALRVSPPGASGERCCHGSSAHNGISLLTRDSKACCFVAISITNHRAKNVWWLFFFISHTFSSRSCNRSFISLSRMYYAVRFVMCYSDAVLDVSHASLRWVVFFSRMVMNVCVRLYVE